MQSIYHPSIINSPIIYYFLPKEFTKPAGSTPLSLTTLHFIPELNPQLPRGDLFYLTFRLVLSCVYVMRVVLCCLVLCCVCM